MTSLVETTPTTVPAESRATAALQVTVVSTASELESWAERWAALEPGLPNPMLSFDWVAAAVGLHRAGTWQIIMLGDGERLLAAAPLVCPERGLPARWELLNACRLHEPADFVYADGPSLAHLTEELARRGLPLFLSRIADDSPTIAAVEEAYRRRGRIVGRPRGGTPYISLDASWSEPESHLTSRRRCDFRRARRHADELGQMAAEIHAPAENEVDALLDVAFQVEDRSWKGEQGTALARDPRRAEFYRQYARRSACRGRLRIGLLRVGEQVAAVQIGVVYARALWVLKVGYDPQFHRCGPGMLLMVEQIRGAVAEGLATYELLGTVEPWIQVWTEQVRECVALRVYPANFRGLAGLAMDAVSHARRQLASGGSKELP